MRRKCRMVTQGVLLACGLVALVAALTTGPSTEKQFAATDSNMEQVRQTDEINLKVRGDQATHVADGWKDAATDIQASETIGMMTLEELVEVLWRLKGEELERAVARLAISGEPAFALLVKGLQSDDLPYGFRHQAVRILEIMNTQESREVLKDMALGRNTQGNPNLERWAAQAYLSGVENKRLAIDLLESKVGQVQNIVLLKLRGLSPDASLMKRLEELIHSPEGAVRISVALIVGDDPAPHHPSDAVKIIAGAASIAGVQGDATQNSGHGYYTKAEQEYSIYINVLTMIKVSDETLQIEAGKLEGPARDLLHVALGRRGDSSARSALKDVIKQSDNGLIRAWAADALGIVGTLSDLALLDQIKKSDQDVREDTSGPLPMAVMPVREAAARAIAEIEKRAAGE